MRPATATVGLVSERSTCESMGAETPERSARSRRERSIASRSALTLGPIARAPAPASAGTLSARGPAVTAVPIRRPYVITYALSPTRRVPSFAVRYRVPSRPTERRRLATLLSACLAALVAGAAVGARAGDEPASSAPEGAAQGGEAPGAGAAGLSLRQQVGQLVMLRFDGGERPAYVQEAFAKGEVAGVILFADNVASESQLRSLTRSLQQAAGGSALISTDQEGGSIRNVPFAAPEPSPATVSRPAAAERFARQAGSDLSRLGVNVNLAPVADVASIEGSVVAGRAYPGDAGQVADLVQAAIGGHQAGGVASTAKHFPGIGAARLNTDDAAVTIERGRRKLERVDLEPFRAAIDADVELVMAGHALYPALDPEAIASQSPAVLRDLLRDELGYEGVIVTDSMEAEAVLSRSPTPEASVASVDAGADLLLTTSTGSYFPVYRRLLREARRDDDFRARVEESAGRVLALKERMGLKAPPSGAGRG